MERGSGKESGKESNGKRQLDLFPFFPFLGYQLYSCAATRLSQGVITVSLLFNCKIFYNFTRFPKFRKCAMEEPIFLLSHFLSYRLIQLELFCDKIYQIFPLLLFAALLEDCFNFNRGYQNLVKN